MPPPKTILIVDDEPDAIAITEAMLSELGQFETCSANDGISGLAKAKKTLPDLIILDLQLPRKDGLAVFKDLKANARTKNIPVIMLTGVAEKVGISFSAKDVERLTGAAPEAYVSKPVNPTVFHEAVSKILAL